MTTKYLFTKVSQVKCDQFNNQSTYFDLEYYITESCLNEATNCDNDRKNSRNIYGIEIVKKCPLNTTESILYEDIYCNREDAEKMAVKLTENLVTPVSFTYVLEDTIGL